MWGSILGGGIGAVLGAIAGGAVTYCRQKKQERERRHRETVRKLVHELKSLHGDVITSYVDTSVDDVGISPLEVRSKALDILTLSADLDDEDLKSDMITALLAKEHDSFAEMESAINRIWRRVQREAYPDVADALGEHEPFYGAPFFGEGEVVEEQSWYGPASMDFVVKLKMHRNPGG